jgi:3-oxoadipate enol-lactonase
LSRDPSAIDLAHDDSGGPGEPLVLIHGAFGDRLVYANQVAYFASTRRIVTLDLRGHGESPKPDDRYSIPTFADDVAALLEQLGIENADVVGHSMGGVVAVELAHRHPGLVRSIATLDSPSIIPGWSDQHMGPYTGGILGDGFREVLVSFLDVASSPVDDPRRRDEALASIRAVPRHVVTSTWEALLSWDPVSAMSDMKAPLLYLDHGQPDLDFTALRQLCPHLVTGETVGAGHRALQEVPDQVNAMLKRFIDHAHVLADHARSTLGSFRYLETPKKKVPVIS